MIKYKKTDLCCSGKNYQRVARAVNYTTYYPIALLLYHQTPLLLFILSIPPLPFHLI
jgi:hypothetical protein